MQVTMDVGGGSAAVGMMSHMILCWPPVWQRILAKHPHQPQLLAAFMGGGGLAWLVGPLLEILVLYFSHLPRE